MMESLEKRFADTTQRLWENQRELKEGLDVAEFHLRAYRRLIADLCNKAFGDGDVQTYVVESPDGPKRIVNMRYYFDAAKAEIQQMLEREKLQATYAPIRQAVEKLAETCTPESLEDIAARVEAGEKILKDEAGKEFELDDDRLKLAAVSLMRKIAEDKKAPQVEVPAAPDDGIPEGAAVFGGENATSDPRNERPQEGASGGGEDGASGSVPEGEVPPLQAGDGGGGPEPEQPAEV